MIDTLMFIFLVFIFNDISSNMSLIWSNMAINYLLDGKQKKAEKGGSFRSERLKFQKGLISWKNIYVTYSLIGLKPRILSIQKFKENVIYGVQRE
jgi:hypothetical protein